MTILLLALAGKGVRTLTLRTGDCEQCALHARGFIDGTIARAHERWPGRLDVRVQQGEGTVGTEAFAEVLDRLVELSTPQVDRREFFQGIMQRARGVVGNAAAAEKKKWGDRPLPTRTPTSRAILLASVAGQRSRRFRSHGHQRALR